jgi:hypothetical protein
MTTTLDRVDVPAQHYTPAYRYATITASLTFAQAAIDDLRLHAPYPHLADRLSAAHMAMDLALGRLEENADSIEAPGGREYVTFTAAASRDALFALETVERDLLTVGYWASFVDPWQKRLMDDAQASVRWALTATRALPLAGDEIPF